MGLIFTFLALALVISGIVWLSNKGNDDRTFWTGIGFIVPAVITGFITVITLGTSYDNYVDLRATYDGTIAQYRGAVTLYSDRAVLSTEGAFTDYKYQDYQKNMAAFIADLRDAVTKYNKKFVEKKVMKKSWYFNWVIFAPDNDMKLIELAGSTKSGGG